MLVAVVTISWLIAPPPAGAQSDGPKNGSPTNTVVVENTKDGSSLFKMAFNVRSIVNATTVAPGNAAVAIASCTDCQTVAIAIQVVFVIGSPTTFSPENAAIAINVECSLCDTLATAFQFVVQSSVPVRLTPDGHHELHDIRKALKELDDSGLDSIAMRDEVRELMDRLAAVLASDVEPRPRSSGGPDAGSREGPPASASSSSGSESSTTATTASTASAFTSSSSTAGTTSTTGTSSTTTTTTTTDPSSSSPSP